MKNYKYIVLGLLMTWTLGLSARTFSEGEELYVNAQQSFNWGDASAALMLYLYNGGDPMWLDLEHVDGSFYKTVFPAACTYNKVTVVRKNPVNPSHNFDGDVWNKKEDMDLVAPWNCLDNFDDAGNRWKLYAPPASAIPAAAAIAASGVTEENIRICASAWDGPFSLRVKLNSDSTAYDYANVTGHGWYYSYDGTTWTAVEPAKTGVTATDLDNEKDLNKNMLPVKPAGEEIYYYLQSSLFAGRRLMHLTTDAPKCDLDCTISSFEIAVSNVNADDNTYTLDGMVAFGVPNGSLVISCGSASVTIPSPKSPQSFSLNNLPATSLPGQTATVTASFTGDGSCSRSADFDVPNIEEAVETIRKDILTGDAITLVSPTAEADNDYVWVDDNNVEHTKAGGQSQSFDVAAFATDGTKQYIYKEYYELSGNMDDLMANGNYESGTPMSEYDNWGTFPQTATSQIDFYDNATVNPLGYKDNGFAIVQNAHNFYPTYAAVTAKEGSNFALFDAKTGIEGGNKKAWYATTAESTDLKLKKGTRYVLSFWAANINNYGEMDNAARFKFYIEDITDPANPVRIDSSGVLDLSIPQFRNNIWHQCSETFYAKQNCNHVRISVVNLNTNVLNVGNDFALDDIQFHAISTVTKVVKSQQKFVVVAHEPKIDAFTATVVPLPCDGGPAYTIQMHVQYQNPKGNLVIRNLTTGVDSVYAVSGEWDTPTDFDRDFIITTDEPTHNWEVFFDGWTTAKKSTTTLIPGFPKIQAKNFSFSDPIPTCALTTTLSFDLDYTYQQGTLHYSIVGLTGEKTHAITTNKSQQTLAGLTFEGIPADGQVRTLHVSFDGTNSCTKDYVVTVPTTFSPVIDDVQILGLPAGKLSCSTPSYDVTVQVTTHYAAAGHNIVLSYDDNGTPQTVTVPAAATGTITTIPVTLHNMDAGAQTITAYLEEAPSCTKVANYTAPVLARITPLFDVNVSETACGTLNYTISGTVNYDMPDGNLVVEYDAEHRQVITAPGSTSANFSIANMTATGTGLTLKAWFANSAVAACEVTSKPFDAPTVPSMDTLHVAYAPVGCTDVNTTLTFDLNYTYQQGTLSYWVDALTPHQTAAYTEADATAQTLSALTFANIPADGKTHTLHVEFANSNSCKQTYTLPAAPFSPVIDDVQILGLPTGKLSCSTPSYDVTVQVTTHYAAAGHNIVLSYDDNGTPQTVTVPAAATGTVTTIPLTLHNMDAGAQTITASLEEAPACTKVANYTAPVLARITPLFDVNVSETACGTLNYTVSGTVNYDMPDGNLVVEYDAEHRQVITAPGSTSSNFSIANMTATGTGLTLKAWFENSAIPACIVTSKPFDAPTVPSMDTLHVAYAPVGCTDVNTTLTFDLNYTYQQGTLSYWVDALTPHQTAAYTEADATAQTLSALTFANIPADGKTHILHVEFANSNSCKQTYILPAAPFSPVIDDVQILGLPAGKLSCSTPSYDVTVQVTTHYAAAGHNIVLSYDDNGTPQTVTVPAAATGTITTIPVTLHNMDAGAQTITAYLEEAPSCTKVANYTAPVLARITPLFDVNVSETACGTLNYTISGTVNYDMPDGNLVVEYDAEHRQVITAPGSTSSPFSIANMTATGAGLTLKAWFENSAIPACEVTSKPFDAPTVPSMDTLHVAYAPVGCTDVNTTLTFDLNYTYQQGTLSYWVDELTPHQTAAYTEADATAQTLTGLSFANIPADGKTHTLHVEFANSNSCKQTYILPAAPFSPVIDDVQILGLPTGKLSCSTPSYDVTVQVTTHYAAAGHNIVLSYDDNGTPQTVTVPAAATGTVTTIPLTLHNMDAGAQTITAYLEEAPSCTKVANYTAPVLARITPLFDVNVSETACGTLNYTVSGTVSYDMPDGNLVVEYDAEHRQVITAPGSTSSNFSIANMTATGTGLTLKAWFENSAIPACIVTSKPFDAPTVPSMDTLHVAYAPVGCTDVNTTLTFDLNYTYQQGTLSYWVDALTPHQTAAYTEAEATALTLSALTFANIPADGKTHTLHVEFANSNSCKQTYILPAAPFSPVIDDVQITGVPSTILCDETSYPATVTISMPYDAAGKDLILSYEGTSTTVAVSGNPTIAVLTLTTADATGLTVSAAYADAPACTKTSNVYNAPTRMSCVKDPVTVCEGESYTWSVTGLTYGPFTTIGIDTIASNINIHDSLFVTVQPQPEISIPAIDTLYDDITEIRVPYAVTKGTPNKFVCTVNGVVSTHAKTTVDTIVIAKPASVTTGDYTIDVEVIDSTFTTCHTTIQKTIHIAGIPSVSTFTVLPREIGCGESSYVVDVHVAYQNPRGSLIIMDKTNGNTYDCLVPTVTAVPYNTVQTLDTVFTIAAMTPASLEWEALFDGWTGMTTFSVAPIVPSMQINAVTPSTPACSKVADVTFDVNYIYQQGQLRYQVDNMAAQTKAITAKDATSLNTGTLTFTDIPADGKTHKLYVTFDGANSCKDSAEFTAPLSQVIDDVQISGVPATILCDEMSYTATVDIYMPFDATGKSIVISYEGTSTTIPVSGNPTTTFLTLTTADATSLTISAAYSDAPACAMTSNVYNAPTRWTCDRDYQDICLGDSYLWHGTTFTPATVGTFGYKDNYDSLYLTVHAEPAVTMLPATMICADENEIRLPFAVTSGTPNKFDIAISGHTFTQEIGLTDTIVLARPSDIPAGSYTATITVYDSLVSCFSTAKTSFIIAEPDLMYRKWDDVVFIDNSSKLFVSYQWYESGAGALNGETKQYLHDGAGLSGTYYCRLVTTTNDTLYTCAMAFDDIVRSRDVTTGSSNAVSVSPTYVRSNGTITVRQDEAQELNIMVYNATGMLIGLYTQNETFGTIEAPVQNGVYVVHIRCGEDVHTTQIIVHE